MDIKGLIKCLKLLFLLRFLAVWQNVRNRDQFKKVHLGQAENTHHSHKENSYQTLTSFQQKSRNVLRGSPGIATQSAPPPLNFSAFS